MPDPLHLRPADARLVPWKNGRGVTRELALWPTDASFEKADFDWRIARAPIVESGPFSSFPGFERTIVMTSGNGLRLEHGNAAPATDLATLVPYRFSGDWPTSAVLSGGPVEDLNVLCRRGRVSAEVEVWRGKVDRELRTESTEQLFLHVLDGSLEASSISLSPGESLWLQRLADRQLALRGDATALLVRLRSQR